MMVSGGGFIVPDVIHDKFIKWETHVPLTYLTDKFCASQPTAQSSLSDFLAVVDGQITTKSKSLSPIGELEMTFDEWYQAWQRLLKLINQHHPNLPLLAHSTPSGPRMLMKATFLARCNQIWTTSGYPGMTGHSFRIGGTTELLTSGIPPDVVKSIGRWSSDSFLRYWRDLETTAPLHARNAYRKKPGRSSGGI